MVDIASPSAAHALHQGLALHLQNRQRQREQLQRLIDSGLPVRSVARLSGRSENAVRRILAGDWRA